MTTGTLHLIPVTLGGAVAETVLPAAALATVRRLQAFVVENEKSARAFLKLAGHPGPLSTLQLQRLDEHTRGDAIEPLLAPLHAGTDLGLLSEAGCPAVADPGAALVAAAHAHGLRVQPHVGPSALMMALMASGLNGQQFTFHGYLPVAAPERRQRLQEIERASAATRATALWIETPYRTDVMLQAAMEACRLDTRLCVAADLTLPTETIATRTIAAWRAAAPAVGRRPAVFLLSAAQAPRRS